MSRPLLTLAALAALALPARAQLSADDELASFELAEDVQIELVADEPMVASPCALSFDERGRLYVAENRGYPSTEDPPQGEIAILDATAGDGHMDRRTVFAEGLTYPNGVLAWKDGVIVTCAPDILFLRDSDGDGVADERRVLLTGFDTKQNPQRRVNTPILGPDGWIYLASGLAGGSITCPEHPERPPLKMTGDIRFNPETLEVQNVDGRSQFGQSFDDFGRRFLCTSRMPVQQVVLPSKWLSRNPRLTFGDPVQDCSAWSEGAGNRREGGVKFFPVSSNLTASGPRPGTFNAACGIQIWRGGALPARYRGCAFSCDPTGNLIHVDRLEPDGAAFKALPLLPGKEFLASRDDSFRPVFLERGNDGALYVADMYRKAIVHPDELTEEVRKQTDFETGKTMGRIWRITVKPPMEAAPLEPFRDESGGLATALQDPEAVARLTEDASPRVRLNLALALGDSHADFAMPNLAKLAAADAGDRWMRAAVLSGISGREEEFLQWLWPLLPSPAEGQLELLSGVGRSMGDVSNVLREFGETGKTGAAGYAALLVDAQGAEKAHGFRRLLKASAKAVADPSTPPASRLLFARLLARGTWEADALPLQQTVARASDDALRVQAMQSLVALDGERAAAALLGPGAWARYSPALREALLTALFPPGTLHPAVLAALENGDLPVAALSPPRRQFLLGHPDPAIRARAAALFSQPDAAGNHRSAGLR